MPNMMRKVCARIRSARRGSKSGSENPLPLSIDKSAEGPTTKHHNDAETSDEQPCPTASPPSLLCPLEGLPAELRYQILGCLDNLNDLKAVVHASPVLHHQYLSDRKRLLAHHLRAVLGDHVFFDACMVQKSTALHRPKVPLSSHILDEFMSRYRSFPSTLATIERDCTADDLADMAGFYLSVIRPLSHALPPVLLLQFPGASEVAPLSRMENIRIMRGLYLFELWCRLFGPGDKALHLDLRRWATELNLKAILEHFFEVFEPWEIKEISCIHQFFWSACESAFDQIAEQMGEYGVLRSPDGEFCPGATPADARSREDRQLWHEGIVSRGLELLERLRCSKTIDELIDTVQGALIRSVNQIPDILGAHTMFGRRLHSDRRNAERARPKLSFTGDGEDKPPLAWVILWNGTYNNRNGRGILTGLCSWGWVFWDADRLAKSGAEKVLRAKRRSALLWWEWDGFIYGSR